MVVPLVILVGVAIVVVTARRPKRVAQGIAGLAEPAPHAKPLAPEPS